MGLTTTRVAVGMVILLALSVQAGVTLAWILRPPPPRVYDAAPFVHGTHRM